MTKQTSELRESDNNMKSVPINTKKMLEKLAPDSRILNIIIMARIPPTKEKEPRPDKKESLTTHGPKKGKNCVMKEPGLDRSTPTIPLNKHIQ